jgi:hypothetical protein
MGRLWVGIALGLLWGCKKSSSDTSEKSAEPSIVTDHSDLYKQHVRKGGSNKMKTGIEKKSSQELVPTPKVLPETKVCLDDEPTPKSGPVTSPVQGAEPVSHVVSGTTDPVPARKVWSSPLAKAEVLAPKRQGEEFDEEAFLDKLDSAVNVGDLKAPLNPDLAIVERRQPSPASGKSRTEGVKYVEESWEDDEEDEERQKARELYWRLNDPRKQGKKI